VNAIKSTVFLGTAGPEKGRASPAATGLHCSVGRGPVYVRPGGGRAGNEKKQRKK
jgi:hypothetical protein